MKEKIYDDLIDPLMAQVIEICKANKIAVLINFKLDKDLQCTTALLADEFEPSDQQLECLAVLRRQNSFAMAETIETLPNGDKKISLRRIS